MYLDYVAELVTEIASQEQEDAFLVTKDSQTIIAHNDQDMLAVTLDGEGIDSLYTEIGKSLENGNTEMISVKGNDGTYLVCLNPVENTDWYLVTYVKEQTVLADLHKMEGIMVSIAVVAAVVLILVISQMVNSIVKTVKK